MSSVTSTSPNSFRPWHLFVLVALVASTGAVLFVRPGDPVVLLILVAAIGSAGGVGFAVYRMLWPLAAGDFKEQARFVGGRTRAALEREKTLILRSIKELEFDRAMSKVSAEDFNEMSHRLRARALVLMKQLDIEAPGYREVIERELAQRLGVAIDDLDGPDEPIALADESSRQCPGCGTQNDEDAKFCKGCGEAVGVEA
jgi:hypothetical protein